MDNKVKFYSTTQMLRASIVEATLIANEIPCWRMNKQDSSFHLWGPIEIYINESDREQAMELLQATELDPVEENA